MKFLCLNVVTTTVISLISGFHAQAIAVEPDYLCFITSSSGQVLDLSESLCGSKKSQPKVASSDRAFVEAYKSQVMKYPAVRDELLASIKKSPEGNIRQARSVCDALKAGLSLNEIAVNQAEEDNNRASMVNASIINSLATQYYCPKTSK